MKKTTVQPTTECWADCPYCGYVNDYSEPPKKDVQQCQDCKKKFKTEWKDL